jgi:hypothetical protein
MGFLHTAAIGAKMGEAAHENDRRLQTNRVTVGEPYKHPNLN